MKRILFPLLFVLMLSLLLTACGEDSSGPVVGDPEKGKQLYERATLGTKSAEGCVSCHNYDEAEGDDEDAPYTAGTATKAESRVPGLSAEEYIHESIVNADAYVVDGFYAGDMYQKWAEDLSEQEIANLVAYLLTEK